MIIEIYRVLTEMKSMRIGVDRIFTNMRKCIGQGVK